MTVLQTLLKHVPGKTRSAFGTVLVGIVASLGSVAFQLGINWLYHLVFETEARRSPTAFLWITFVSITIAALFSSWLLTRICPEAAGSGIPQLKVAYWKDFGYTPARISWIKFIAGVVSIGGGLSLGREGPSVQIGGSLGSWVSGLMGNPKQRRRAGAAAGAAAGLAAAFNAPLAGVAFVLEEILEDLNSAFLGSALLAAVVGAFVVHALIGAQPAFEIPHIGEPSWRAYVLMPIVAALAVAAGLGFQSATLWLRGRSRALHRVPKPIQLLLGAWATWAIAVLVFSTTGKIGVFSLGYDDLSTALRGETVWQVAAVLLIGKLLATVLCYGLGGCGGIFSPTLFFGGMAGALVAGIASRFVGLSNADTILLAVGGMSACLGAVVQAPLTALLIIFEMTHQFALVPGLMLAGLVSLVITRATGRSNFYEEILMQDGHEMEHVIPPRDLRSWQELPISAIANFSPMVITDLSPEGIREKLSAAGYARFPVVEDGSIAGILRRAEVEAAQAQNRPVKLERVVTALPGITVKESQRLLIESSTGMLVLTDKDSTGVLGIVTLHDLLRTQVSMSERHEE
ncbi:chloride channel protein [Verrucomicrobiota bacterium sgz303538]